MIKSNNLLLEQTTRCMMTGGIFGNTECYSTCPCSDTIKKNLEFCSLSFRNLQIISWLLTPMGSRLTRLAG